MPAVKKQRRGLNICPGW